MKRLLLTTLHLSMLTIFGLNAQAKWDNNWLFGHNPLNDTTDIMGTILNFDTDPPTIIPVVKTVEFRNTGISMSNIEGELAFYSNGCILANALNDTMPDSDSLGLGLLQNYCDYGSVFAQGCLSVPKPGSNTLYYLFNFDLQTNYYDSTHTTSFTCPRNLYYSTIDMTLNGGLGGIVEKNQLLLNDTFPMGTLQACMHENGVDWWLLVPKALSNCYHTYLITENGISNYSLQCTGTHWSLNTSGSQAVFAPNKKKYIRYEGENGLHIYDFDANTGTISNGIQIPLHDTNWFNGAAVSSNSRYLYTTSYTELYQFDLLSNDIGASKTLISAWVHPSGLMYKTLYYQARLAPNGKIYISGTNNSQHIHTIHNPNCPGTLCNFEPYAIEMYSVNAFTMPNFPNFKVWPESDTCALSSVYETNISVGLGITIVPNPAFDHILVKIPTSTVYLSIYDAKGGLVFQQINPESTLSLDTSHWAAGIYSLQCIGKISSQKKFIILHP